MKPYIYTLVLVGMFGLTPLCYAQEQVANTSIEEIKKETKDLLKIIGSYSIDKKDQAVKAAKEGLNKLDKRIDSLESKVDRSWDKMNEAARKQTRENLKSLRKQRNELAEWYGSMKNSSENAWENMKKGFSKAYQALEKSWEKSEKEFSSK